MKIYNKLYSKKQRAMRMILNFKTA